MTGIQDQDSKKNRPHCLYLWFLHGEAVCSEENLNRSCAYPFWDCPAKEIVNNLVHGENRSETVSSALSEKTIVQKIGST